MSDEARFDVTAYMAALRSLVDDDNLATIRQAEDRFGEQALKMYGFVALSRAFQSFVVETILTGRGAVQAAPATHTFMWLAPRVNTCFQTICAAERSAMLGYPVPAFAQLRNVFDTAVINSAVAQGFVTCDQAEGIETGKPFDPVQARRARKRIEADVNARMYGERCGLSDRAREQLRKLNSLYDDETHGQRLSRTQASQWLAGQGPMFLLPNYDEMNYALFMNRFSEVSWMVHRLLPLLRIAGSEWPHRWQERWKTLDMCFCQTLASMTRQLKKPIGAAVVEFVAAKFPFDASSTLPC